MIRTTNNGDLSVILDNVKYNFRVGAILEYKDNLLIEQSKGVQFVVILGGRVKLLDDTSSALMREIKEELGINIEGLDNELLSVIESFFVFNNIQYHELYFIYKFPLESNFGITDGMQHWDSSNSKFC